MGFYHVITTIATIVLILCLTFTGYMLWKNMHKSEFPPTKSACPDFWKSVGKDTCENVKGLGDCCTGDDHACNVDGHPTQMRFGSHFQNADKGPCRKATWAKKCKLDWNGFTNNDTICDVDTSN